MHVHACGSMCVREYLFHSSESEKDFWRDDDPLLAHHHEFRCLVPGFTHTA